jgi:hypothetical protein
MLKAIGALLLASFTAGAATYHFGCDLGWREALERCLHYHGR